MVLARRKGGRGRVTKLTIVHPPSTTAGRGAAAAELERLLAEPLAESARRADSAFDTLNDGRPVILYGAGGLGRQVHQALRATSITPLAFADRAPNRNEIDGLPLLALTDAVARYGEDATFVVTVFNPSYPFLEGRAALEAAGCRHVLPWLPLGWKLGDRLLPQYAAGRPELVLQAADDVRRAFDLLDDDASRDEYLRQLRWRLHGEYEVLVAPLPVEDQYFSADVVRVRPDETFVDCGAYDGDTLAALLQHAGGTLERFVAFEPDPENLRALEERLAGLPDDVASRVEVVAAAVASTAGTVTFGGTGAAAGIADAGGLEVQTVVLDEHLDGPITYLKMDIEGAELDGLAGAATTVARDRPVLTLCVYHAPDHLWRLPLAVQAIADGYTFRMRRYGADCWDVILYALPPGRAA